MSSRSKYHPRELKANASPKSMTLQCDATIDCEARASDGKTARPTFSMLAYGGGIMRPPGFYKPVVIDLSGLKSGSRTPILLDHNPSQIVGQSSDVKIANGQINLSGIITGEDDAAKKVLAHAKNGFVWAASVGLGIDSLESVSEKQTTKVNGQEFNGPLYVVRAGRLNEVSFVGSGADETASASVAASAAKGSGSMNPFHEWLKAKGFDPDLLADGPKTYLKAQFEAELKAAGAGSPPPAPVAQAQPVAVAAGRTSDSDLDAQLIALEKANERRESIKATALRLANENPARATDLRELVAAAESGDWDVSKFELEAIRIIRAKPVSRTSHINAAQMPNVVEAAVCMHGKLENIEKVYSPQTLEAASRAFGNSGLGLTELLLHAARENGMHNVSHRNVQALLKGAFPNELHASGGVSTFSLPNLLANVSNKFLLQHFNAVDNAWSLIASRRSVSDFKQITSYSLTGDFEYQEIGAGGDLKSATAGETGYTNQAKSYGRLFAIDRRDIINDDLGAFTGVTRRLGRGSALKINRVFWALFLNNSSFFTSGRGNAKTGATTAFGIGGLQVADQAFLDQTDPDGNPLGVSPAIVLVPTALKILAMRCMNSVDLRELQDSTSTGKARDVYPAGYNPFSGRYQVVSSPYMSNSAFTGYSAAAWYLLASPQDMPVIEGAFLNGVETPTVESAAADFDTLGIKFRGYHDFGFALQEYRGGVRMAGS